MTKQIIKCRVGTPVIANSSYNGGPESIWYRDACCVDVETTLDRLVENFQVIKAAYPDFTDLSLEASTDCGCRYDCSCSPTYYVVGKRLETDLEYDFRLRQEAKIAAAREARERAEYEKLKAKFGN